MLHDRRLSTEEKAQIRALNDAGFGIRAIGRQIGGTHCLILTSLQNPDGYNKKKDTGRRRTLTAHHNRQICRRASNICLSLNQIRADLEHPVSKSTVWRALLHSEHIVREIMKKAPHGKKFNLDGPDGEKSYWHDLRKNPITMSCRNFGGGSMMCGQTGGSIRLMSYGFDRVHSHLLSFVRGRRLHKYTFQQDNASVHASQSTKTWLLENKVNVMDWPACRPDPNPIVNF
ncbi:hypothetical protein ANCDUO_08736 [Ancylostoma duodenale]|uniref:Transposable element Tc3 transposase-like DNA-binding HTH domain-containing protein n=1 Tax=Ancylostoma duodenale TaxID=51022 RepID=A0A0C2GPL4_9BILA|nr:hypothetical protein ANCDUO_08736 [Ancylostoma duodenale]